MIKELWRYRKYIFNNALGELRYRYAGSSMGFIWHVLNPLFQILVYTFVFSNIMIAKMPDLGTTNSFSLYLCSGLFGWLSFSECISRGTNSLIENSTFLKKLPIPEYVFIAQTSVSSLFNSLITYILLFVYYLLTSNIISYKWVLVPLILILFLLFGFGISLLLGGINVFIKDTYQVVVIVLTVWMWVTPIVYVKEILPAGVKAIFNYNLAYPYIEAFHQIIIYDVFPSPQQWLSMILISGISILLGSTVLGKITKEIRDLI